MNWLKGINWLVCVMERGVFCEERTAFLNNIEINLRFHMVNAGEHDNVGEEMNSSVTVAKHFNAYSNNEILGPNQIHGMDISSRFVCVCILLCWQQPRDGSNNCLLYS
jgi:hypothetical protein